MNKKENSNNVYKIAIINIAFFIITIAVYGTAINTNNHLLLLITAFFAIVLIILNLLWVFKNKKKTNEMRKLILKKDITNLEYNPLEVFLIDKIWYHRKALLTHKQIYSALLYEISLGNLIYENSKIKINKEIEFLNILKIDRISIEIAFLNSTEIKQNDQLKLEKLEKLQKEEHYLTLDDIRKNINDNCKNRSLFYDLIKDIKKEYFVDIENDSSAILTMITWLCIILEFAIGVKYVNDATVLNFYLPISLAIILCILITSKYRERVILKDDKKEEITKILNYIKYIETNKDKKIDKIYLYGLNKLDENDEIVKIFR